MVHPNVAYFAGLMGPFSPESPHETHWATGPKSAFAGFTERAVSNLQPNMLKQMRFPVRFQQKRPSEARIYETLGYTQKYVLRLIKTCHIPTD